MAFSCVKYPEDYVNALKSLGQYLIDNAENIISDNMTTPIASIYISTVVKPGEITSWSISKDYYVNEREENEDGE